MMVKQNRDTAALRGRRAVQAEQTRREILGAARRQFAASGYAATSLKGIAAEAGVSVQTVYDSVGSKADLVRRLNDLIDEEAGIGDLAMLVPTETDPAVVAAVPARITRRILERCGEIVRISLEAARSEPGLAPVAEEGGRRHRAGARRVAERLVELDALDDGLDVDAAARSLAALSDPRLALVLLDDHDLDLDAIESWMSATTLRAVLPRQP
jgi:AcrR family transcriptional regulator